MAPESVTGVHGGEDEYMIPANADFLIVSSNITEYSSCAIPSSIPGSFTL
jgi:hypothetical protein